jgi:hypothetical protein
MRIVKLASVGLIVGLAISAATVAGAATATAQPSTPPSGDVTVTLSAEQLAFLCDKRLPKVENRAGKLAERINGGADVKGSTAWLKARAQKERDAGRESSAQLLEERADRRAGRLEELNKIKGWAADFRGKYCGGAK